MENSRHESIELQTVQNLIPTFFIIYLDYVYTIGIFDTEFIDIVKLLICL